MVSRTIITSLKLSLLLLLLGYDLTNMYKDSSSSSSSNGPKSRINYYDYYSAEVPQAVDKNNKWSVVTFVIEKSLETIKATCRAIYVFVKVFLSGGKLQ